MILFINLGFVLALIIAYISPGIDPELTWSVSFFGLFYPVLLIINVLFVVFWIFKNARYALLSLISILIGWNQIQNFIGFHSQKIEHDDNSIAVMTYNISNAAYGYDKVKAQREIKKEGFIEFLT